MVHPESTEIETVRVIRVPPNPNIFKALGSGQSFEAAIADLIDNSLDAEASRVVVRFVLRGGKLAKLLVIDNGKGMNEKAIDAAVQLGRPRKKSELNGHGYYGMGLKSASFGQASILTVFSRKAGFPSEGRRMYRESAEGDFEVDVLRNDSVGVLLDELLQLVGSKKQGTVVQWDRVRDFPHSRDPSQINAYLDKRMTALHRHLGLTYHRLLEANSVAITIDAYEADDGFAGAPVVVEAVNPFGYNRSGKPGYPKELAAQLPKGQVRLQCHIWPARSESPEYRLYGQPVENFQGLYLYRNKRLLRGGGWGGILQEHKSYKLARVAIDIDDHLDLFKMSVDKSDVELTSKLVNAIEKAQSTTGTTFSEYLDAAKDAFKKGNTRQRNRTKILPPGQGLHPAVKAAIERESPLLKGQEPVRIRWEDLAEPSFVAMDRKNRTLWLNKKYRTAVAGDGPSGVNDAPLVKALLFLLFEDLLRGRAMGPKDKETYDFWMQVLTAAADAEQKRYMN